MLRRFYDLSEDEAMVERLQQEARQTRPEFSEELHRRVWEARELLRATEGSRPARAGRARPARLAWAAAAAAGLLACATVAWYGSFLLRPGVSSVHCSVEQGEGPTSTRRSGIALVALMDSAQVGVQQIDRLAGAAVCLQEWTCLHHDAQLALSAFAQDFPLAKSGKQAAGESPNAK